jgi:hypothetical protein
MSWKPEKPKTRKAPAAGTALAQAIERCEAAQAAYDAIPDDDDAAKQQLSGFESDVVDALARMPCASDAEFLERLCYLLARETRIFGEPHGRAEFGSIVVAVDRHINPAAAR